MKNEMEKVVKKGKAFLSNCAGMADGLQEWVGHVYCPVLNPVFTPPPLAGGPGVARKPEIQRAKALPFAFAELQRGLEQSRFCR